MKHQAWMKHKRKQGTAVTLTASVGYKQSPKVRLLIPLSAIPNSVDVALHTAPTARVIESY